jgi:ribosomal protein S27AE
MTKSYYAGQDVDAPCGRCGGETRHQVLTVTNGVPDRLICGNCRSVHKFRAAKPEPLPRTPRIPAAAKSGGPRPGSLVNQFQQALAAEQGGAKALPYQVAHRWEEGSWMDHPTFGLGRVQRRLGKKVDVLFKDGLKTLVSA